MKGSFKAAAASVSALLVALTGVGVGVSANVPEDLPQTAYEMIEDFNSQTAGEAGDSVKFVESWGGQVSDTVIAEESQGDMAYQFTSQSEGDSQKVLAGIQFDVDGKKKDLEADDAIGLYLKVEGAAQDATEVGFNIYLKDNAYAEFRNSTAYNSYTLIDKDGKRSDAVDSHWVTKVPADFEGWLIVPVSTFTDNGGDGTVNPTSIVRYYFMLGNGGSTKGVKFTWDDLCVVKDIDAFAEAMAPEEPQPDPDPGEEVTENQYILEDFNDKTVGTEQIAADFPDDPIGNAFPELQYSERTDSEVEGDKALTFKGVKQETGAWYAGLSDEAKAARFAAGSEAFAFYLKLDGVDHDDVTNHENKFRIFLKDEDGCDFRTIEAGAPYKLVSKDGTITDATTWAVELFDNFEGWVIIPTTSFQYRWGAQTHQHEELELLGSKQAFSISTLAINFATSTPDATFMIDDISIIKDMDTFIEEIGGVEEIEDIRIEQTPEESKPITADVFESLKANGNNLVIEIGDGYPLYTWTFAGTDVATPADFDPLIATDFDEIAEIEELDENLTAYFIKVNDMPGKATLSIYLEDVCVRPYLYQYQDGKATLVSDTPYETLGGYVDVPLSEGGVYFFTDAKLGEAQEDNGNSGTGIDDNTDGEDPIPPTGGASYVGAFALLAVAGAVVVLTMRRRQAK